MSDYCVLVADGARARFFTLEPVEVPEMESGPNLIERRDLVNTEKEASEQDLMSDVKPGRNRTPGGGAHAYDDHRRQYADERERRFARRVAKETAELTNLNGIKQVVLVAEKRMLGFLRSELTPTLKSGLQVQEVAKDMSKASPRDLHEYLAKDKLLPRRKGPGR
jgi:protein required for attachment to host cells